MRIAPRLSVFVALLCAQVALADRPYRGGAVATAHPVATEAALEMLNKGGNAVDAAVAAAFALAVVGPYHSGLGGGGFALTYDAKSHDAKILDFREVAPKAATRDMYVKDGKVVPGLSVDGPLSVAVPGAVMGYLELQKKAGKLPLKTVLAPAIKAAKDGFWVTPKYRQMAQARIGCLAKDPEASRIFLAKTKDGQLAVPEVNAKLAQPELGKTLETLVKSGAKPFYEGPLAQAMVKTVQGSGGLLSLEDLKTYAVRWRAPLSGSYRGHKILTMPPPSAGGVALLQILGMVEAREPTVLPWKSANHLHDLAEAMRRTYVDRAKYLGDPAFTQVPLEKLVSRPYTQALAKTIDPNHATSSMSLLPVGAASMQSTLPEDAVQKNKVPSPEGRNTTHISVIDRDGNAVAMTTTVNYGFGSCLVAKGTGILLNDEMDDFAAQPMVPNAYGLLTGEANSIAPGKIPLSSMSPTMVFQKEDPDRVLLVVGSPGGSTIPTTVTQVVSDVVDYGMGLLRAVGDGRIHHQYMPDLLAIDRLGLEPATRAALEAKGHKLQDLDVWGDAEAVMQEPGTNLRYSASDPRNAGGALGQD